MLLQRAWRQISAESRRGEERRGEGAKSSDCTPQRTVQQGAEAELKEEGGEWVKVEARGLEYIHYAKRVEAFNAEACKVRGYRRPLSNGVARLACFKDISDGYQIDYYSIRLRPAPPLPSRSNNPLAELPPCATPLQSDIYRFQLLSWLRLSGRDRHCVSTIGVLVIGDNFEFKINFLSIDFIFRRIIRANWPFLVQEDFHRCCNEFQEFGIHDAVRFLKRLYIRIHCRSLIA